jgi:hypothetical protein
MRVAPSGGEVSRGTDIKRFRTGSLIRFLYRWYVRAKIRMFICFRIGCGSQNRVRRRKAKSDCRVYQAYVDRLSDYTAGSAGPQNAKSATQPKIYFVTKRTEFHLRSGAMPCRKRRSDLPLGAVPHPAGFLPIDLQYGNLQDALSRRVVEESTFPSEASL